MLRVLHLGAGLSKQISIRHAMSVSLERYAYGGAEKQSNTLYLRDNEVETGPQMIEERLLAASHRNFVSNVGLSGA